MSTFSTPVGLPLAPHLREPAGQLVREHDRHRHQLGCLVARVAEHHALVARARRVERVGAAQVARVVRLVHPAGDVGRLAVQRGDHADRVAVEAEVAGVVADVADHLAGDGGEIEHRLGGDLPGQHHKPGGQQRLDRHPRLRVRGQRGVHDRVGDLVGHLVRVALGHGF
jgi:hypothetical protein